MKLLFRNSIKTFTLLVVVSFLTVTCRERFSEYNRSPDQVTQEDVDKDGLSVGGLLPGIQQNILPAKDANNYQRAQNLTGDIFSGYMAAIGNWNASNNNTTYNLNFGDWNQTGFASAYTDVMTPCLIIKRKNVPDAFAVSQIMKIGCMHRITDNHGPIPYSKFGNGELQTPYDSQESVYMSFFDELTNAVKVLEDYVQKNAGAKPLQAYDLIYDGDYVKWIKYANSLKLRLAMRIVYADASKAQQFAEEAVNDQYGVITDNADNVLLKSGKGVTVYNPLWMIWNSFVDTRMGASMESYLKGYKDPRISKYFKKTTLSNVDDYVGVRNGIEIQDKKLYADASVPNVEADSSVSPIQIMVASETYFLRAEGAVRGWNMKGSAQELYEKGISTSFDQHGVSSSFSNYKDNSTDTPARYTSKFDSNDIGSPSNITIKWEDGASMEVKLERIITQKWLAMYPDGQEAWSELRRTGYPKIFPIVKNNSNGVISTSMGVRRIPFPNPEYTGNQAEVLKAIGLLGGPDNGATKVWWDKK